MRIYGAVLNLFLAMAIGIMVWTVISTHEAPEMFPHQDRVDRSGAPVNVPVWEKSDPCTNITKAKKGDVHETYLVVTQGAERVRMSFTESWAVTHDNTRANDVWVIGYC